MYFEIRICDAEFQIRNDYFGAAGVVIDRYSFTDEIVFE